MLFGLLGTFAKPQSGGEGACCVSARCCLHGVCDSLQSVWFVFYEPYILISKTWHLLNLHGEHPERKKERSGNLEP